VLEQFLLGWFQEVRRHGGHRVAPDRFRMSGERHGLRRRDRTDVGHDKDTARRLFDRQVHQALFLFH
jgi:hypothetical protein